MTGNQKACSATARDVFFAVTGTKSHTNKMSLGLFQRFWTSYSFQEDTHDDMIIETDQHLGDVQVVGVGLRYDLITKVEDAILDCHWYVDYISIIDFQNEQFETHFPCYHWIGYNNKEVSAVSKVGKSVTTYKLIMYCVCALVYNMCVCIYISIPLHGRIKES